MPQHCLNCRATIPADAPSGLCPTCLSDFGLAGRDSSALEPGGLQRLPPAPEELQALFPHLEIVRLIGRGGMGAVYEADQRGLGRKVALKILWAPSIPDAAFEQRFMLEGRTLARLSHDNVVSVHDAGRSGPYYWLLMEYVDGPNLRQMLQRGRMDSSRALKIVARVCAALEYAHRSGVVHRDIKPENILITRAGRLKIADFGLAKILARDEHVGELTQSHHAMGTPHYMAPEQIERPKEVDHRADIYALGIVLYELLTGELPLGRFELPSRRAEVDPRLDGIVTRALQRDPARRYAQASEMGGAVRTVMNGRAVGAARIARAGRSSAERRGRWIGAAAILATLGLLGSWAWQGSESSAGGSLTPREHAERGRALVASPKSLAELEQGIGHLQAAREADPALVDVKTLLVPALRAAVDRSVAGRRFDVATQRARELAALAPGPGNEELLRDVEREARAELLQLIEVSPAPGAVLTDLEVSLRVKVPRTGFPGTLLLDGEPVELVNSSLERRLPVTGDGPSTARLGVRFDNGVELDLPIAFTFDTTRPLLVVEHPAPDDVVPSRFEVRGTVDDLTACKILVGTASPAECGEDGSWQCTVTLPDGPQEVAILAEDRAGNRTQERIRVVVDARHPVIEGLVDGQEVVLGKSWEPRYANALDENMQSVRWDGEELRVEKDGRFAIPVDESADESIASPHQLVATDRAGNETRMKVLTRRDLTKPKIAMMDLPAGIISGTTLTLKGRCDDRSKCVVVCGGEISPIEGGEFTLQVRAPNEARPGEPHYVELVVRDEVGNETPHQVSLPILEPCARCEPADGLRGRCPKCKGAKEYDMQCNSECRAGLTRTKCPECEGSRKEACTSCGGSNTGAKQPCTLCIAGERACGGCGGSGSTDRKCGKCNGRGKVPFSTLGGTTWNTCLNCDGRGKVAESCSKCRGSKKVRCDTCKDGWQIWPCPDCVEGRGNDPCNRCDGQGGIDGPCTECGGDGKRTRDCHTCRRTGNCPDCGGTGKA